MHLFDPQRPEIASGRKRLIGCTQVVPSIDTTPINATTIELEVMLRSDRSTGYLWYLVEIPVTELSAVMAEYIADPEAMLKKYFDWAPTKDNSHGKGQFDDDPKPQSGYYVTPNSPARSSRIERNAITVLNEDDL